MFIYIVLEEHSKQYHGAYMHMVKAEKIKNELNALEDKKPDFSKMIDELFPPKINWIIKTEEL